MCCVRKILFLLIGLCILSFVANYFHPTFSVIFYYAIFINTVAFGAMGIDKYFAIKQKERIPEKSLYLLSFIGGFVGIFLSVIIFAHKNKKRLFLAIHALITLAWIGSYLTLVHFGYINA